MGWWGVDTLDTGKHSEGGYLVPLPPPDYDEEEDNASNAKSAPKPREPVQVIAPAGGS